MSMTLDEAIKHAEEVAEQNEWFEKNYLESIQCKECAEKHRQLAEWLKDYKRLKEQDPVIDKIRAEIEQRIEQGKYARSVFRYEKIDAVKAEQCTGSISAYRDVIKLIDIIR